jgi:uncharacterized protein YjbI with pentapeptide repeats
MAKPRLSYQNSNQSKKNFAELAKENNLDLVEADFSYAELYNTNFSGLTLHRANFAHAKLNGTIFEGADLRGANFSQASIEADSSGSLRGVNFCNSKVQGTSFYKSVLRNSKFTQIETGLVQDFWVKALTVIALIISGFTATIASTFFFYYFLASPQKASLPGQKPSKFASFCIFVLSVLLIIGLRIILHLKFGDSGIHWHVRLGVFLILAVVVLAWTKSNTEADRVSLAVITIIALSPILIPFMPGFEQFRTSLAKSSLNIIPGLGAGTDGSMIVGAFGAIIGASFGSWFSRLAICKDENLSWLNLDWLWKWYVKFTATGGGTNFDYADLTGADFTSASLKGSSFEEAIISKVHWHKARYLDCAYVGSNTYLKYPGIRYLLVVRKWEKRGNFDGLDLEGIDLRGANLENASFVGTNLNEANLQDAKLINANLKKASLDRADLTGANLTGACIQSWSIDEETELKEVECEYVFLKDAPDPKTGIRERLPNAAAGEGFQDGDFETLFTKDSSVAQLFIRDTDNRNALSTAFQQLIADTNSVFQGFEIVGDSALVKIRVSQRSSKDAVSNNFYQTVKRTQRNQQGSEPRVDTEQSWRDFVLELAVIMGISARRNKGILVQCIKKHPMEKR